MKLLYNFASRGRSERFFQTIENIISLSRHDDYIILASLDVDDSSMNTPEIRDRILSYGNIIPYYSINKSKIEAINKNIHFVDGWDIIINISDDQEFLVEGFDLRIIKDMEENFPDLDGVLHYHDSTPNGERLMTMSIIGKKYFNRTGNVYYEGFLSVYCDEEETRRAKELGKYKYFPDKLFKHNHWLFNRSIKDELNERNDSLKMYEHDRNVFLKRNPTLLINYATRGRRDLFFQTLDNIQSTIKTSYYKIFVKADEDDLSMNNSEVRKRISEYKNVHIFYLPHSSTKISAINAILNYSGDWSWMINMSDDFKFVVNGWDELMLKDIQGVWGDSMDWFAHFPDGYVNEKLPTMSIIGRHYYQRDNYIYHHAYKSVSCDAEEYWKAQLRGLYHYFPKIYFKHLHPCNLQIAYDETYKKNDTYADSDTKVYFERMKRYFDVKDPVFIPNQLQNEINNLK